MVFQLVAFLHNKLVILQPEDVSEAFIATDFSSTVKATHNKLEWPKDWRRMHLRNINDTRIFVYESDTFLKNFDRPILYYKLRFIFTNRTVLDLEWIPVLWNSDLPLNTYYSSYLIILIMFCSLSFIFSVFLFIVKYRTYYENVCAS